MTKAFTHPSSVKLLGRITDVFKEKIIFQRRDRPIIFLCGGPTKAYSRSMRKKFLCHFKKKLPDLTILLAERAILDIKTHNDQDFFNLADFENLIVAISDCILIFPESPGSIAELGFFSNNKDATKKLLVVNNINEQLDSFINIGLNDRINSKSNFRPVMMMDYSNSDFSQLEQRITERLPKKTSKKFDYKRFTQLHVKQKMFVIFQILYIFRALTLEDILFCINAIFMRIKETDINEVNTLLSILTSGDFIKRVGDDLRYFIPSPKVKPFFDFRKIDIQNLRTDTTSYFKEHHYDNYKILVEALS